MNAKTPDNNRSAFSRRHERTALIRIVPPALAAALLLQSVAGLSHEREGRQVVEAVCIQCHGQGTDGAPKIGDHQAWSQRAALGLSSLTRHALDGIRKMPAHGGQMKLTDLEVARAITYMVNQSGGNWVAPTSAAELAQERSGKQVVSARCATCHQQGLNGAPKIGDQQAWVQRLNQGLAYATRSAIRGHGGMPARGGQANLTDEEIQAAILYMFNPASATAAKMACCAATTTSAAYANPNQKRIGGIEIYLGFIAAERLRKLPREAPERAMHGGIPRGSGYYHVNVTLNDVKTGAPLKDAHVQMVYERLGLSSDVTELQPMEFSAGSYGNYIKPRPGEPYRITLQILPKGAFRTIEAKFENRHFK